MRERDRKKFKSTEAFYFDLKLVILRLEMREIKQVIYRSLKKKTEHLDHYVQFRNNWIGKEGQNNVKEISN